MKEGFLVGFLGLSIRVFVHFILILANFLWLGEASVHHVLVVCDETHFTFELRIEVVLALRESITLLLHGRAVAPLFVSEAVILNIVLPQTVVEGALAMGWVVHET